jgi:hypothetical protein
MAGTRDGIVARSRLRDLAQSLFAIVLVARGS